VELAGLRRGEPLAARESERHSVRVLLCGLLELLAFGKAAQSDVELTLHRFPWGVLWSNEDEQPAAG
jgi:hypothetical protein